MAFKLCDLVNVTDYRVICGDMDITIDAVTTDSRVVKEGTMFIAIFSIKDDGGHKFVSDVISKGANCVVVDSRRTILSDDELVSLADGKVTVIEINDTSKAGALIYANYLNNPQNDIEFIGVTGTKGKTTATFMIYEILKQSGINSGLLGTVCNYVNGSMKTTTNTTLPMPKFYDTVKELADGNTKTCVMEVSSHGLKQNRVYGVKYKVGCFTNFFEDHIGPLDHPTMEDYFLSKMMLFERSEYAVMNSDCVDADKAISYAKNSGAKVFTYGLADSSDCVAKNITKAMVNGVQGSKFNLSSPWYAGEVEVAMLGEFNVYNALMAISVAGILGIDFEIVKKALVSVKVPGRVQSVNNNLGISCLVDYAHNKDSLISVLKALKPYVDGKIITVFGCGGNRSVERRYGMGRAAGEYSDYSVITSDNPRDEEPMDIIKMIEEGMRETSGKYEIEESRELAIEKAIKMAKAGDLVLVAGKGHEDYQEIKGIKTHFDDFEVASNVIAKLEEKN